MTGMFFFVIQSCLVIKYKDGIKRMSSKNYQSFFRHLKGCPRMEDACLFVYAGKQDIMSRQGQ